MIRLNLLGGVDLRGDDERYLNGDVGGPKYLALLIYLILEGADRPIRRDSVVGALWPDVEQKRARASLSQGLTQLKGVLGDVVIPKGQEELIVNRDRVTTDCFEYSELANTGELEKAATLYRGDVAAGFILKDAPEFEQWLSIQQTSWRDHHASVIQKLIRTTLDSGDLARSVTWAEKLVDVAPDQEAPVHALLRSLVERGQAAAAKRLYDKHQRALADVYGTTPSEEITELVNNLPHARPSLRARRETAFHVGEPVRRIRVNLVRAAAALAVLVVGSLAFVWYDSSRSQVAAFEGSSPKVAVLPFASVGAAQRSANVLNEALQWRLRNVGFEVLNAGNQDTAAIRKLVAGSRENGVTFVVGGDVAFEANGSVAARLWLKDAGNGKRVWQSRFTQRASDAHLIATQLSDAVTTQIRRAAGSVLELAAGAEKVSPESWKDVYRARERMEAATDMRWQEAAAGAAAELKDAELRLMQVSEREPDWGLPWVLRARIAEARAFRTLSSSDSREGAAEIDRGIRMLDSVATQLESEDVYEMRGLLQYRRFVLGVDDVEAANLLLSRAEANLRKSIAPGRDLSRAYAALSGVMSMQGKYAEAFVYARRAYDSNVFLRNNEEVLVTLFNSSLHAEDDQSADHWCKELQKALPGQWPAVLCRIHVAGFAPSAVDVGTLERAIENVVAPSQVRDVTTARLKAAYAITLAQVGRADSARATLASVADSKDPEVVLFRAFALAALKDAPQAHAELRNYLAEYRGSRSMALHMRWLN